MARAVSGVFLVVALSVTLAVQIKPLDASGDSRCGTIARRRL
jgi:hypothetical protein